MLTTTNQIKITSLIGQLFYTIDYPGLPPLNILFYTHGLLHINGFLYIQTAKLVKA